MSTRSVVIPTWNGRQHLPACLAALLAQTQPVDEIIVVDNASTDGTAALLRDHYPQVVVITNRRNEGFATATNQGILAARGEIIIALNDDTAPAPMALAALVEPFNDDPHLGACAATLVFADRPGRVNAAGLTVGSDFVALDAALGQTVDQLPPHPWPVFGPSGGAAAYRRAALDDVGLFDGRFFAYLEDVDLAWRLRLRGWSSLAVSAARVVHHYSATAGSDSPFKRYHLARNRIWCLAKNVPGALWRQHAAAVVWYDSVALLVALANRDAAWLRGRRDGLSALHQWWPERRIIQQRRRVDNDGLAALLGPRIGPLGVWRTRRMVERMITA